MIMKILAEGGHANTRQIKDALFGHLARVAHALANPKRLELLDVLAQAERSVEALAKAAAMSVGNASAQLKVLREAGLVESRREGQRVVYRLADDSVLALVQAVRGVASGRLAEVGRIVDDYLRARDALESVTREELVERLRSKQAVVIDVRPAEEYQAGHIPGAISLPLAEMEGRLAELPRRRQVVAYCRGPFCVLAPEAIALLRARGFKALRLEDGFPEWRLEGLPIAVGDTDRDALPQVNRRARTRKERR